MTVAAVPCLLATCAIALAACGEDPPARDPSTSNTSAEKKPDDKKAPAADDKKAPAADDKKALATDDKKATSGGGGKPDTTCKGKPEVGKNASTFSISSVNGGSKMSIEKGKVTIVDFWATWCEPCKKSFPKYQDLYVKYKASGLEIVAVSVDDEKKDIPEFIKSYGAKFPVGWDEGHKIAECWKPPSMPSAFVIDKNGVVKHLHNGYHDGEEKELEKEIKALL
jgi:peroxiredoxin